MKQIQRFECPKCGLQSQVYYEDGEGVFDVVWRLEDCHKNLAPQCSASYRDLKVRQ